MKVVVGATEKCNVVELYKNFLTRYTCIDFDQCLDNNPVIAYDGTNFFSTVAIFTNN